MGIREKKRKHHRAAVHVPRQMVMVRVPDSGVPGKCQPSLLGSAVLSQVRDRALTSTHTRFRH